MNRIHLRFAATIWLPTLLLLAAACQDQTEKNRLDKFTATAKMQEENKRIAREVFAAIDGGNFDKLKELLSDDFSLSSPGSPQPWKKDDLFNGIKTFYASFPDWTHTVDDIIADSDKVVIKLTGRGTQKAIFEDIPPTGKKVTQSAIHIMTLINGKVKEWWAVEDNLGLMTQLGMELKPTKTRK